MHDLVTYLTGEDERDRCLDELRRTGLRLPERDRERDIFFSSSFSGLTDLKKWCIKNSQYQPYHINIRYSVEVNGAEEANMLKKICTVHRIDSITICNTGLGEKFSELVVSCKKKLS